MSSAQPGSKHQPRTTAASSIQRAKAQPTIANVVDAISELHTEVTADLKDLKEDVGHLKEDVGHLKEDVGHLKEDVGHLKEDVGHLKKDVGKLLDHFGLVSGDPP